MRIISMLELILSLLLLLIFQPVVQSGTPYTIYGYVSDSQGAFANGISVTVIDVTTSQSIKTTTIQGAQHAGFYQVNLGNMATQWNRGHSISIYAEYWSNSIHYFGSSHFNVPNEGYNYFLNVTIAFDPNETDHLSNIIEAIVTVVGE